MEGVRLEVRRSRLGDCAVYKEKDDSKIAEESIFLQIHGPLAQPRPTNLIIYV